MKKQMKKRILSTILVLSMVISIFLPVNNLVYATSTNKNLFICNSTLSSAHFVDEKTYIDKKGNEIILSEQTASDWFNQHFNQICDFKWISNPKDPITVEDFLLLLYYMQMSAEPDKSYPRRELDFEDLNDYYNAINMIQVLASTGTWDSPSILSGTKTDTGLRLDLGNNMTREQAAKIIDTACNDWYELEKQKKEAKFTDIDNTWAKNYIQNAYKYGFINGVDDTHFEPSSNLSIEQAIMLVYNIMNAVDKYTVNNFVSALNNSDIGKITKVYSPDFTDTLGARLSNVMYYFNDYDTEDEFFFSKRDFPEENTIHYTDKTLYTYHDSNSSLRLVHNIYAYLTDVIGPIKIIPPDVFGLTIEDNGGMMAWSELEPGSYKFKIINEFGIEDTLTFCFYFKPTDLPLKRDLPDKKLGFKQSNTMFLKVGDSVDLNDYLQNVSGNYHVYCESPKYVSFDGKSKITLIKRPPNIDKYNTDSDKIYICDDYFNIPLYIKYDLN